MGINFEDEEKKISTKKAKQILKKMAEKGAITKDDGSHRRGGGGF